MKKIRCSRLQLLVLCYGTLVPGGLTSRLYASTTNTDLTARSVFVELSRTSLGRFVNSLTPIEVPIPTPAVTAAGKVVIEDLKYCKASTVHSATLLGYGHLSSTRTTVARTIITDSERFKDSDCMASLTEIKNRVAVAADSIIAKLTIDWQPWKLAIRVDSILSSGTDVSGWKGAGTSIPSDSIPIAIGNQNVPFNATLAFTDNAIGVLFIPTEDAHDISSSKQVQMPSMSAAGTTWTHSADVRIKVTHQAINYFAAKYFGSNQQIVASGVPVLGSIALKNLAGSAPTDNQYDIKGILVDGNHNTYDTHVAFKGNDLALSSVTIEPTSSNDFTIKTLASTFSGALSSPPPTGYKGIPIRKLIKPDPVPLKVGTSSTNLRIIVSSVSSSGGSLRVGAWVLFEALP